MKSYKPIIRNSALGLSAIAAAVTVQAQPDYGSAIWHACCNANWYTSGYGHKFAVIHVMEGYYGSTVSYFTSCSHTSSSVHYAVNGLTGDSGDGSSPAGEISQMVRESNYAWHALCWNQYSWGTEHEGFTSNPAWFSDAMYAASAGLQAHLATVGGFPKDRNHIVGHGEKSNANWVAYCNANFGCSATCNTHTDPGSYWDWNKLMSLIGGGGSGGKFAPAVFYDGGNNSLLDFDFFSSGTAFSYSEDSYPNPFPMSGVGANMVAADFNGDGYTDICVAYQNTDGTMSLYVFPGGRGYNTAQQWYKTSGGFNMANVAGRMVAGDFAGNGHQSVEMFYDTGSGHMNVYRFINSANSAFTSVATETYPAGFPLSNVGNHVVAGDFNGDGKTDVVAAYQNGDGTMNLYFFNGGSGTSLATSWWKSTGGFNMSNVPRMVAGDFNKDGKCDVYMPYKVSTTQMNVYQFKSTGAAFGVTTTTYPYTFNLDQVGQNIAAGDVNGDGTPDIVLGYTNPDGTASMFTLLGGNVSSGAITSWTTSGQFDMLNKVSGRFVMGNWK